MKRKESEMKRLQSEEQCVESERPNEEPMSKDFTRVPRRERRKVDKGWLWVAFHLSQYLEKSQDYLYRQRVAGHAGGDSHVYEKQGYDHRYLCGEHHPASPWDLQRWNQQIGGDEIQEATVRRLAMAFVTFESYQLTVKSNEVFFILGALSAQSIRKKRSGWQICRPLYSICSSWTVTRSVLTRNKSSCLILCGFQRRGS